MRSSACHSQVVAFIGLLKQELKRKVGLGAGSRRQGQFARFVTVVIKLSQTKFDPGRGADYIGGAERNLNGVGELPTTWNDLASPSASAEPRRLRGAADHRGALTEAHWPAASKTTPLQSMSSTCRAQYWLGKTYEQAAGRQPTERTALIAKARTAYELMPKLDSLGRRSAKRVWRDRREIDGVIAKARAQEATHDAERHCRGLRGQTKRARYVIAVAAQFIFHRCLAHDRRCDHRENNRNDAPCLPRGGTHGASRSHLEAPNTLERDPVSRGLGAT